MKRQRSCQDKLEILIPRSHRVPMPFGITLVNAEFGMSQPDKSRQPAYPAGNSSCTGSGSPGSRAGGSGGFPWWRLGWLRCNKRGQTFYRPSRDISYGGGSGACRSPRPVESRARRTSKRRSLMRNGLLRRSNAPAFRPSTANCGDPPALRRMIGTSVRTARICSNRANPFIPGK